MICCTPYCLACIAAQGRDRDGTFTIALAATPQIALVFIWSAMYSA